MNNHKETDKIDYLKVIFDKSYQRTLVILLVNITFLPINGPQTLTFFGELLLNDIYKRGPPSAHMDVALDLNMNLVAETLGLILFIYIIGWMFKKKMLTYALGLCVLNFSHAFLIQVDNKPLIQLGMMLLFIIQWGFCLGSMTVYSIEVTNNTTFGLFYLYQFSSNFTFGMMTPTILSKVNTCLLFVLLAEYEVCGLSDPAFCLLGLDCNPICLFEDILSIIICWNIFAMGRRFSIYLGTITATISVLFLLIDNMWAMIFGKLVIGKIFSSIFAHLKLYLNGMYLHCASSSE